METHNVDYRQRHKRNAALSPTPATITLQQIRQEINNKFNEVCNSSDRIEERKREGSSRTKRIYWLKREHWGQRIGWYSGTNQRMCCSTEDQCVSSISGSLYQ